MTNYSPSIAKLIAHLRKLPGVGHKSAQRLAFYILALPEDEVECLADALLCARKNLLLCSVCQNYTETDPCDICSHPKRDSSMILVVESAQDVATIERTHEYNGLYHVLHGVYSPMDDVGIEQIKLMELIRRLKDRPDTAEVIIATNQTVEGEATALYISRLLKPTGLRVTRIASGLPMGSDIEYADDVTLAKAISGRHDY